MALDCKAPSVGYDTPEKAIYRRHVWAALIPAWELTKHDQSSHVLIMPSREGLEIPLLISMGVPEDRIIAIDKSAAVIATSKWRKSYPKVKFFAATVGNCGHKIKAKGWVVCAANLDFCSNFCEALIDEYYEFMSCPKFPETRIAVTIAKGRESKALVSMLRRFGPSIKGIEEKRIAALIACGNKSKEQIVWDQGGYTSNKNPMAWIVLSDNYIKEKMLKDHIEELNSLERKKASDGVVEWSGLSYPKEPMVLNWIIAKIIEPFVDLLEQHNTTHIIINKKVIGGKYSEVESTVARLQQDIWALTPSQHNATTQRPR